VPKPPAESARQLALLRWPLLALVIASGCAVVKASWTRLGLSDADQVAVLATKDNLSDIPASQEAETSAEEPALDEPALESLAAPSPITPFEVTRDVADPVATASSGLTLVNSPESAIRVGFSIDGEVEFLEPGESCELLGEGPWEIAFHRGAELGDEKQTLSVGRYDFSVSLDGWRLEPSDATAAR
jgi:hypothetical protein